MNIYIYIYIYMSLNRHCYVIGKIALQYVILKNNINMECKNYIPLHV